VNFLINMMLDSLDWNDHLCIPRDLIVLIRHQTGGGSTDWDQSEKLRECKSNALIAAFKVAVRGKTPSIRAIANDLGVSASTVMRWFPQGELAKRLAELTPIVDVARAGKIQNVDAAPDSTGRLRRPDVRYPRIVLAPD
jgi:hypothetical protein